MGIKGWFTKRYDEICEIKLVWLTLGPLQGLQYGSWFNNMDLGLQDNYDCFTFLVGEIKGRVLGTGFRHLRRESDDVCLKSLGSPWLLVLFSDIPMIFP